MKEKHVIDPETGSRYGTYRTYITGFILSIIITGIAFYLVSFKIFPQKELYILVTILAIIQLFVQLTYFLHLSFESKFSWNMISFIFTIIILLILVIGTLWIMFNLYNMMLAK